MPNFKNNLKRRSKKVQNKERKGYWNRESYLRKKNRNKEKKNFKDIRNQEEMKELSNIYKTRSSQKKLKFKNRKVQL